MAYASSTTGPAPTMGLSAAVAELINLNKARKARARTEAERQAAENRLRFGRTKAQKQLEAAEAEALREKLDGLRREPPTPR